MVDVMLNNLRCYATKSSEWSFDRIYTVIPGKYLQLLPAVQSRSWVEADHDKGLYRNGDSLDQLPWVSKYMGAYESF